MKSGRVIDRKKLSESKGQIWVLVEKIWVLGRENQGHLKQPYQLGVDPLFLMDLAFRTPSVRGPGLRDTSLPSSSNNISPLLLTKIKKICDKNENTKI